MAGIMSEPYIINKGRGRLILNEVGDQASLMIDVAGAGQTILLSKVERLTLALALVKPLKSKLYLHDGPGGESLQWRDE